MKRILTLLMIPTWMQCFESFPQETQIQNIFEVNADDMAVHSCNAFKRQLHLTTVSDVLGLRKHEYNMTMYIWSLTFDFDCSKSEIIGGTTG